MLGFTNRHQILSPLSGVVTFGSLLLEHKDKYFSLHEGLQEGRGEGGCMFH